MSETEAETEVVVPLFLPYTYVVGRLLVIVPTLLLIIFICGGFAGWGPGHDLINLTHYALHWIDSVTELHWT